MKHRRPRKAFVPLSQRLTAWLMMLLAVALVCVLLGNASAELKPYFSGSAAHDQYRDGGGLPWAILTANDVNFRAGPGLHYEVVASWCYGAAVEVLGEKNGWVHALHWTCPEPVWIWGEYLQMVE